MYTTKKKAHPLRAVLFVLLALVLLLAAFPFLYSLVGGFRDYDDILALAADGPLPLTVEADGTVCFAADKAAVYGWATRAGLKDQLLDSLRQTLGCSEKALDVQKFGYTVDGETLCALVKAKLFGFIPVQLCADTTLRFSPNEVQLQLDTLRYGKWIALPLQKCAAAFDLPVLTDGFIFETDELFGELSLQEVTAADDVLSFRCDLLNKTAGSAGASGAVLAELTPLLTGTDTDAAKVLRQETAAVYGAVKDAAALSDLLTGLLRLCSKANAESLKPALESIPLLELKIGDVSVCAADQTAALAEELNDYETALVALRNNYKEKQYRLGKDTLYDADGLPAEAALPAAWDARFVLQYNQNYESIVKANDGSLSPTGTWIELPNPKLSDLRRERDAVLPNVPGITVFDLTVALRMADGTPAILFLTATDELGLNVISEQLYEQLTADETLPVCCSSDIIAPDEYLFVTPDEAQRDLMLYTMREDRS